MAFKTVSFTDSNTIFTKSLKPKDTIEGVYLALEEDQFGKPKYRIMLSRTSKFLSKSKDEPEATLKSFPAGEQMSLLGGGSQLDYNMKEVKTGNMVRLTYEGKAPLPTGPYAGTEVHQWKVEVDDEEPATSRTKEAVPF